MSTKRKADNMVKVVESMHRTLGHLKAIWMRKPLRIYLFVNLLGMFLYFDFVESIFHMQKQEERSYSDFGDSIQFLATAVPIFLACQLYTLILGIKAILDIFRRRNPLAALACGLVTAAWVGMIEIIKLTH